MGGPKFISLGQSMSGSSNKGSARRGWRKTMSLSHRLGLLGRKVGMMRIFTDDGDAVPVTVLDVSNNRVTQVKTESKRRLRVPSRWLSARARRPESPSQRPATWPRRASMAGEVLKRVPRYRLRSLAEYKPGATLPVALFAVGQMPSTCKARPSARASPARSSATTSARSVRRTATAVRTTCRARSRWRRTRAVCSRAKRCRDTCGDETVDHAEPRRRAYRRSALSCCSCKRRGAGLRRTAMWSPSAPPSRPSSRREPTDAARAP